MLSYVAFKLTDMTFPKITVSTFSGLTFAAAKAALAATVCSSIELVLTNFPPKVPKGVRLAPTMNTPAHEEIFCFNFSLLLLFWK